MSREEIVAVLVGVALIIIGLAGFWSVAIQWGHQ